MVLHISPTKLITDVQKEFNNSFPFLKLEFYPFKNGGVNVSIKYPGKRVGECQSVVVDGMLDVYPEMKVSELESALKDKFKLNAQVFRSSGSLWLQTTMTDHWTLQKQNDHGMELSQHERQPGIKANDLDIEDYN